MIVILSFPLCDLRAFLADKGKRLPTPTWPDPAVGIEFVRGFGVVQERKSGGSRFWPGEHVLCDASGALRFATMPPLVLGTESYPIRCAFRRFFADGDAVARIDVGVAVRGGRKWRPAELVQFVAHAAALPVRVGDSSCKLVDAGPLLAKAYARASTPTRAEPASGWAVRGGRPIAFAIARAGEADPAPPAPGLRSLTAPVHEGLALAAGSLTSGNSSLHCWTLIPASREASLHGREVRIHATRLESHRRSVSGLARELAARRLRIEPRSAASSALQNYMLESVRLIDQLDQESPAGALTAALAISASESEGADAGTLVLLSRVLHGLDVRPNVRRRFIQTLERIWGIVRERPPIPPALPAGSPALQALKQLGENQNDLAKLRDLVARALVVPFLGAGVSAPCGYPGWSAFLLEEAKKKGILVKLKALLKSGHYEEAAAALERAHGDAAFLDMLERRFGGPPPGALKGPLLHLPAIGQGFVVTTNFDELTERVYRDRGLPFDRVILGGRPGVVTRAIAEDRRYLLKLHGDVADPESVVLTLRQYRAAYGSPKASKVNVRKPLPAVLRLLFTRRTMLFIGASLTGDRTMTLLRTMAARPENQVPLHYAIISMPKVRKQQIMRERFLADHRIRPIWFPEGKFDAIETLLEYIAGAALGRRSA